MQLILFSNGLESLEDPNHNNGSSDVVVVVLGRQPELRDPFHLGERGLLIGNPFLGIGVKDKGGNFDCSRWKGRNTWFCVVALGDVRCSTKLDRWVSRHRMMP